LLGGFARRFEKKTAKFVQKYDIMALRLKKISIKGYKSIAEAELALRNLNVLIGANGAGKSNFIAMFGFLRRVAERRLQVSVREAGGGQKNCCTMGAKPPHLWKYNSICRLIAIACA
jgi:predicted ATPase